VAMVQQKFDGGVTGQSTTSMPWKFDAVHRLLSLSTKFDGAAV